MICKNNRKNVKHLLWVFIFSFIIVLPVFSQIEANLSQYMFHSATFNPASIGDNGMINVTGQQRFQWIGIPGAPQTTYFTINAPFNFGKNTQAVGINFLIDKAGAFKNQSANIQYSFKKKVGEGILSLGAGIGFMGLGISKDSLENTLQSEYHDHSDKPDNAVPEKDENGMGLDLSAGLFYSTQKYYAGISYVHLNNPSFHLGDKTVFHASGIAYLTGGFDINFENPKFILKSSSLAKSDFTTWQVDLSSRLEYDKKFWGGLSYRFQDAVIVFAGLNVLNGITIGYAYDLPTGALLTVSSGSHEVFLSYSFAFDTSKNKNKYKSIRIL
ncbi:putative membrane protein [uncultured Paludibacter sp.]|uniref:Putative membrane protein n=1 Tax=uncultured Paludibacter sp. TaxID=497635 RepID=A0A653AFI7_9BACT|nr:putative membrane protein [uncultured Paludibacter sp.]